MKVKVLRIQLGTASSNLVTYTLDDVQITMRAYTNKAFEKGIWHLDFTTQSGVRRFGGRIVAGIDMLQIHRHLDVPPGRLFAYKLDPSIDSFADGSVRFMYLPINA